MPRISGIWYRSSTGMQITRTFLKEPLVSDLLATEVAGASTCSSVPKLGGALSGSSDASAPRGACGWRRISISQ